MAELGSKLAALPLADLQRELPHKLDHLVLAEADLKRPRELHPSFYGCFDWHSAVHGHWMLARLARLVPGLPEVGAIHALFDETLTAANLETEAWYFASRPSFERTYGWAWLLELARELRGTRWEAALRPLADVIVAAYRAFLPKQTYPIRTGVHANTAFGLSLAFDYAVAAQHRELEALIRERALTYFGSDRDAPARWEPSGEDFFSPTLIEADLMRRVLPPEELVTWLRAFLPELPETLQKPAVVTDRSDGKLAHLDGLTLSRAWCMRSLASVLPDSEPLRAPLAAAAVNHTRVGLAHVSTGHYAGEHWLASFAVYMLGTGTPVTLRVVRMVEERFHRDVEGRPIREGRTPPEFLKPDDIEYKQCPYSGTRHQHVNPMNVSALRQTGVHWDAITDALARLRTLHDRVRGVERPELMDIWRVSQLGSCLPWFFIFHDAPVPAYAAALAKTSLGMGIWAQRLLVRTIVERWSPPAFTADNILKLAEDSGTLIGQTEVCSGGDKMLLKYFDVHVGPREEGKLDVPDADVLRFGAHYAGFKLYVWLYYLARRFLYADVGRMDNLRELYVEPSDFFIVEPTGLADVEPEQRAGWFRSLAELVVPFAPDSSDLPLRDMAFELARVMGEGREPSVTFGRLDELFGRVVAHVEAGLRGGPGGAISSSRPRSAIG